MDPDLIMVVGVTLGVLSIPSLLSAYSGGRPPRFAAAVILIAAILVLLANHQKPGGYTPAEAFGAFRRVISGFM